MSERHDDCSRRFGFEQMDSHYDFTTRLLVAIDTSGSVGSEELGRYLCIINSFFKYGIQEIEPNSSGSSITNHPTNNIANHCARQAASV